MNDDDETSIEYIQKLHGWHKLALQSDRQKNDTVVANYSSSLKNNQFVLTKTEVVVLLRRSNVVFDKFASKTKGKIVSEKRRKNSNESACLGV